MSIRTNSQILAFLLLLALPFRAEANQYNIKHFGSEKGLTEGYIYYVLQDEKGLIWIASSNGLFKFDGYQFSLYSTKDGLKSNFVRSLSLGPNNSLILGYDQGSVSKLEFGEFDELFQVPNDNAISSIKHKDGKNYVLSRNEGLHVLGQNENISLGESLKNKLSYDFEIFNDQIFVATSEGAFQLNLNDSTLEFEILDPELEYINTSTLYLDTLASILWIASEDLGLMQYDLINKKLRIVENFPKIKVKEILKGDKNELWLASNSKGIIKVKLNPTSLTVDQLLEFPLKQHDSFKYFTCTFIDKEGSIWFGSYGVGIFQFIENAFASYKLPAQFDSLSISSVIHSTDSNQFFGTNSGLLKSSFDAYSDRFLFSLVPKSELFNVSSLFAKGDYIWIGTQKNGVWRYSISDSSLNRFELDNFDDDISIRHIAGQGSKIWISVVNRGVIELVDERIRLIHNTNNGFIHNEIYHILPRKNGTLWFGTKVTGLAKLEKDKYKYLNQESSFSAKDINYLFEDEKQQLWVGTEGQGLYVLDDDENIQYTTRDGLLSNFIIGIHESETHLWVAHHSGLSTINKRSREIENFSSESFFDDQEIIFNPFSRSAENKILIGLKGNQFFSYDASKEKNVGSDISPEITSIKLFSKDDSAITSMFLREDIVRFEHNQNELSFFFKALTFLNQEKIEYEYRLLPYETNWKNVQSVDPNAIYTNLSPGEYQFEVRMKNNSQARYSEVSSANLLIQKPYWNQWWFYLAQLVLYLFLFLIAYKLNLEYKFRNLSLVMTFILIFLVFEYFNVLIEPYVETLNLGAPIYKVLINLIPALFFLPLERGIKKFLAQNDVKTESRQ